MPIWKVTVKALQLISQNSLDKTCIPATQFVNHSETWIYYPPHTLYVLDLVNSYREGWIALNAKFGRLIFLCDIQVEYEIGENYSYVPDRGEVLDFS